MSALIPSVRAGLSALARAIHTLTAQTGRLSAWLSLAMVLTSCAVVLLRYAFDYSAIYLQETVMYLHASLFMLGAAYTWQQGGHVRVDILYQHWSPATQRRVDLFGTLCLLLPTCLLLFYISWDYVRIAWAIQEKSQEAGGLPLVYLLKSLILLMPSLMMLQALAQIIDYFLPEKTRRDADAGELS